MRYFRKVFVTLLTIVMIMSAFSVVVSAETPASDYNWTLSSEGVLDVKITGSNSSLINVNLLMIDKDTLGKVKVINFDLSAIEVESNWGSGIRFDGSYCPAADINLINDASKLRFHSVSFSHFSGNDKDVHISSSDNLAFRSVSLMNVALKSIDFKESNLSADIISIRDCSKLESFIAPEAAKNIDISHCANLVNADVSACADSLTLIEIYNTGIKHMDLSNNVKHTNFVLRDNKSLSSVNLPEGITRIEYAAFRGCTSLKSVTLPASVTKIGSQAFKGCKDLKSIYIPNAITKIETDAFEGCNSLKAINFGGTKEEWEAVTVGISENVDKTMKDAFTTVFGDAAVYFKATGVDGWKSVGNNWYYYDETGSKVTGWKQINGTWYYFDSNGLMLTGWQLIEGKWYFFNSNGSMATGWLQTGGKWYFMDPENGNMLTGWQKVSGSWYYLDPGNGDIVTGWQQLGGKWYYFASSGRMQTGWQQIGGKWYFFNAGGDMATGWVSTGGKWYYMDPENGDMITGWLKLGSSWYYLKSSGEMATGLVEIDGRKSEFNTSGVWLGYVR